MATPEDMAASMVKNMKEKTGKPLEAWLTVAKKSKLSKHGEVVKHLKTEHGLGHGFANLVAHEMLNPGSATGGGNDLDLVQKQYGGPKAGLRPIYDALIKEVSKFGKDVELAPKKAYVSLRRSKQFAIIQPSTKIRVDVGINLKGAAPSGRLEASGSFNAIVSHRVRVSRIGEVDKELIGWLKQAYEAA